MHRPQIWLLALAINLTGLSGAARAQNLPVEFLRSNPKFVQPFREVVQPIAESTLRIQCDGRDTCLGTVAAADGWILTKAHDLRGKIVCKSPDGRAFEARLIGVHEPFDLALLKIADPQLRVVQFADSRSTKPGSWVASAGIGREPAAIGVVSVATRKVNEAYLGVLVDAESRGLVVAAILQNSAAFKAGLRSRDVIIYVNGQRVSDADYFQQVLGGLRPGDKLALTIQRNGRQQDVDVILQSREQMGDYRSEFQNRLGSELSNRRSGYSVLLTHDSVLKPSDCGGALVDLQGRVIGINISRAGRVETWAIPVEIVQPLIAELKSGRYAPMGK